MISNPYTTFDQDIRSCLEDIFIELLKIYQQKNGYAFHFIGKPTFTYLTEEDLSKFPDVIPDYEEKFYYIKNRVEVALKKHPSYALLNGVYLKGEADFDDKRNLRSLAQLIDLFNKECATIIKEFINNDNDKLSPLHRHYKIDAFGLDELLEICQHAGITENKVSDFFIGIKPLEDSSPEFKINLSYDALFSDAGFEDKIESLLVGLMKTEFWQFHRFNYLDQKAISKFQEKEYKTIPEETFKAGFDFAKLTDLVLEHVETEEAFKMHYPRQYEQSTLYYEFFEEELIISSHAYIIHQTEYGEEYIDWDYAPSAWIPREVLSEYDEELSASILLFLVRKLYYFQENLDSHLQKVRESLKIKNEVQANKYLLGYFKKVMNNPTLKIQIIEGIKFPKVITDLYLKAKIGLIKKRLHQEKGTLFKEKYTIAESPFTLSERDLQITDTLAERISAIENIANNSTDFYYPTKLFWDKTKDGELGPILEELCSTKYLYKGKPYMELADVETFIYRNFTFDKNPTAVEKNQISLPFNSFIGPIRLFLYLFKDKYYNGETEERFAQMLRDNFYGHFQKHKIDLTFESLSKIASNMHKGSNKIDIKLPK